MTRVIVRQESNIQSTTVIQTQDMLQAHSSEDSTQLKEGQVRASRECSKKLTSYAFVDKHYNPKAMWREQVLFYLTFPGHSSSLEKVKSVT